MIRKLLMLAVAAAIIGFGVYWVVTMPSTIPASALAAYTPNVANGKTVFDAGGCTSCHGVPGEDRKMLGGGMALPSPFGTFYAPNISPHPQNGIGSWTEAQFVTAVLRGTSPAGEHYFPAFPYASYHLAKTEDVRDLFAYLKTLPPLSGKSRPHELPFPFNIRRNVGGWKFLFFDDKPFQPDPKQSAEWNRGSYLVNGLGHCVECHSPRNAMGGIISSQRYAGGPNPEGEGWVPNITQKRLGAWREKDFAYFLETGETPDGDTTGGVMARVIKNMSQLTPADRHAMAVYLKSLAPIDGPPRPAKKTGS